MERYLAERFHQGLGGQLIRKQPSTNDILRAAKKPVLSGKSSPEMRP
jgi:hypothetical protein